MEVNINEIEINEYLKYLYSMTPLRLDEIQNRDKHLNENCKLWKPPTEIEKEYIPIWRKEEYNRHINRYNNNPEFINPETKAKDEFEYIANNILNGSLKDIHHCVIHGILNDNYYNIARYCGTIDFLKYLNSIIVTSDKYTNKTGFKSNLTPQIIVDLLNNYKVITDSQKKQFKTLIENNFISNEIEWYNKDWELIRLIEYLIKMTPLNINENYTDIFDFIIKNFLNAKHKNNIKPFIRKIIQTTWNRKQKEVEKYNCSDEKMKLNNLIKIPNLITFSTKLDNIFNK